MIGVCIMKRLFKISAAAAMVGVLALAASGCGGDSSKKANITNEMVKFGVTNFADNLDPADNFFSWVVMRYGLGECLVKFDNKMNATPWLADKWSVSDDKLTWTFHINDKVKFSNGDKLTAEIAKESLERTFKLSNRAQSIFRYAEIKADGQNLMIKTVNPTPSLPGMLADPLFIIIDTKVKDRDIKKQGPICTGPYAVKTYSKAKAVMVANPNYWDGTVPFKNAEISTIDDPNTRAMALPLYAEATQADAKKIGIKVNMKNVDYNVLDPMRQKGQFDLIISNILTANTGDPEVYLNWYWKSNINGSQPQNSTGYSNPKFDALSDKLAVEFDPAKRRQYMIEMQQILLDDGVALFFGYPKTNMVSKAGVANANIFPADYYWLTKDIAPKQ